MQALPGQRVGDHASYPLVVGQPTAPGRLGQHGRDLVVAAQAGDLLGEVGTVLQVGAPAGRQHQQVLALAGVVDVAADLAQRVDDVLPGVGQADQPGRQGGVEADRLARLAQVGVGDARVGHSPAELLQQVDGQLRGGRGEVGVDAALVALGGLGHQLVPARGPGHGGRVEVRGLDQDVGRGGGDLGGGAAHDPGDGQRRLPAVGDQQVLGQQRALDAVQRP